MNEYKSVDQSACCLKCSYVMNYLKLNEYDVLSMQVAICNVKSGHA